MPIYEYACKSCGNEFETLVRSGSVPHCPSCSATELEKKLSVFATAGSTAQAAPVPGPCGSCGPGCLCAELRNVPRYRSIRATAMLITRAKTGKYGRSEGKTRPRHRR